MSTPSMVLLCAGAVSSLAGVWALAGLSERSSLRSSERVLGAAALAVLALPAVYFKSPAASRASLSLPLLFAVAALVALLVGAAKLEAALAEKDGPRALRRAAGLIAGTALSMAAIAAVSLELLSTSPLVARFGWACMVPVAGATVVVFTKRARLAGGGALTLGTRGLVLSAAGLLLLGIARFGVRPQPVAAPAAEPPVAAEPAVAPLPEPPPALAPSDVPAVAAPPASVAPAPAPSGSAAPVAAGAPGQLQIEAVVAKGLLEADARGPVERRFERLQACLAEPNNQQSGALTLRVGIDGGGSVGFVRAVSGELVGTPLAACLLPLFYQMGFAAPSTNAAHFEITLRSPAR